MKALIDIAIVVAILWYAATKLGGNGALPFMPDTIDGDPAFVFTEAPKQEMQAPHQYEPVGHPEQDEAIKKLDSRVTRLEEDVDALTLRASKAEVITSPGKSWLTDLVAAEKESKKLNKPIYIDFETSNCIPCQKVKKYVYEEQDVFMMMKEDYILVWHYVTENTDPIAKRFGVDRYPTGVVLMPNGDWEKFNPFIPQLDDKTKPDRVAFMQELSKHTKKKK